MAGQAVRNRYTTSQMSVLLAATFALLFTTVVALLAVDQQRVLLAAERLQQQTVPEIIRFQRLTRNLEKLRQEGERLLASGTPAGRQESLFMIMLVASHPSILEHPPSAKLARDTEAFLVDAARLASEDPATLPLRLAEWQQIVTRLNLLVDDLSVEGVNLVASDLVDMTAAMRLANYQLIGTMLLVGGFLVLTMVLLRKHLLCPLQRIDRALSSLNVDQPTPDFPEARLAEIHAVEEASKRLHSVMLSNQAALRKVELLASRDDLTGLINRRHFMDLAEAELRRAQRYNRPVAIAFADLDFFKNLNDTYGHHAGDVVLCAFAHLLSESVRQSDLVCRYGGEEFALLFPESTVDKAHLLVERFRERVADREFRLPDGARLRLTLSIGLADASHCAIEAALKRADLALYEAKRRGRNQVVVATDAC